MNLSERIQALAQQDAAPAAMERSGIAAGELRVMRKVYHEQ